MFKKSLLAAMLMGAGLIGAQAVPASAMPVAPQPGLDSQSPLVTDVADRRIRDKNRQTRDRVMRYDRRYHGPRCSRWSRNCSHFHNGWYYGSPWWTLPLVGTGVVIGSTLNAPRYYRGNGSRHVRWCLDHYRSYNVRTNTWVAYSGEVRQCVSPYRR